MTHTDQGIDELFDVRNAYYMGNYQLCIKEAQKVKNGTSDAVKLIRDLFMYRSYLCQKKFSVVFDEISKSAPTELQAVRLLAEYLTASVSERSKVLVEVENILKKGTSEFEHNTFYLTAGQILMNEGNLEEALKVLQNGADDLECDSAIVECLLKMHREDLAIKHVKKMQEKDEDSTLTQLSQAWVNIYLGKEKLQDAFYIVQEIIDKYGGTPLLWNAQASILVMQNKYDQAEKLLQESMDKDSNNPETLINLAVVSRYLGKSFEVCNRYINQMKDGFPNHPWTKECCTKEHDFDRLCRNYEASSA